MNVVEALNLGKRYGSTWALRECTLVVPEGRLAALVGPNGAGSRSSSRHTSLQNWSGSPTTSCSSRGGNVQVAGEVEDLLAAHRTLLGPASESERYARQWNVVHMSSAGSQVRLLVRSDGTADRMPPGWVARPVTLEELTLEYLRESGAAALPDPTLGSDTDPAEVTRWPL